MLEVGKILKAHGIRGAVKAESFMDSPDCFMKIKVFFIKGCEYKVEKITQSGDFLLIKFVGIEDMNSAEELRNAILCCEHDALPEPAQGRFYITDLLGCVVSDGENSYGKICDILQYGSADVIVTEKRGQKYMFPWIAKLSANVDIHSKIFLVDGKCLKEVLLDEN